jgi:aminoglycoside phosphotransferase (APT) family kinase protein
MPGISLLDTLMADPMGSAEMIVNVLGTTHARIHGLDTSDLLVALTESGRPAESLSPFKGLVDISALADASRNPTIASLHKWLSDNRPVNPRSCLSAMGISTPATSWPRKAGLPG